MKIQNATKVLFIRSNPVQPDPRVEKAAKSLSRNAFWVNVLAWDRDALYSKAEYREGYSINRLQIKSFYGSGLKNIFGLFLWQIREFSWLIKNRKAYDIIHACDFDTVIPALFVKYLFQKIVVYDIFDFYADHVRYIPRWLADLIRKSELFIIKRADAVILVDEHRKKQIKGVTPQKLVVINNTPPDIFAPNSAYDKSKGPWQLKLVYVGILLKERGLMTVLDILRNHPGWHLDLAGFGGDQEAIISVALNMPNVTFHGRISYERSLTLAKGSDVLLALYDPDVPNHKFASPNKLYESMMLGKPIIVNKEIFIDKIVEELDCGLVVDYHNPDALENALEELVKFQDLYEHFARSSRKAYEKYYRYEIMEERLLNLYRYLIRLDTIS